MVRLLLFLLFPLAIFAQEIPRAVLGIYDSGVVHDIEETLLHTRLEMPLNHLGIDLLYHDIQQELPNLKERTDLLGIITCFEQEGMDDPEGYLDWASHAVDQGLRYLFLQAPGFLQDRNGNITPHSEINRFLNRLGLYYIGTWISFTGEFEVTIEDPLLLPFETTLPSPLPSFARMQTFNAKRAKTYFSVTQPEEDQTTALIALGDQGGYVATGYAFRETRLPDVQHPVCQWIVNPFTLIKLAFGIDGRPIPDTTTLAGRRLFYSHIDGDGWNNLSDLKDAAGKAMFSSVVIQKEILETYLDFPVTVSAIAADLDPEWVGSEKAQEIAREMFALDNVELASHTYSHPFDWQFFHGAPIEKEIPYLRDYPYGSWESSEISWWRATVLSTLKKKIPINTYAIDVETPRAFANEPFNLEKEIEGSIDFIQQFAPKGKKLLVYQWSGDCLPWAKAVALTKKEKILNINGGNNRFDEECFSYCCLGPIGRKPGGQQQIYASMNNENEYTFDWSDRFFGFRYLVNTIKNSGTPRRIKPINVYYHFYSGEKVSSLDAVKINLDFVKEQEVIPIWTSRFLEVANGFFTLKLDELAPRRWKISNRQGLGTIRFEPPIEHEVDFSNSVGVIGQRKSLGCLYVTLDQAVDTPILQLASRSPSLSYLVDSSWEIDQFERSATTLRFHAAGWGVCKMRWKMQEPGEYRLTGKQVSVFSKTDEEGVVSFEFSLGHSGDLMLTIQKSETV